MTKEEAIKHIKDWVVYAEDDNAIPDIDQPCSGEEIIEAMKICAKVLSNLEPQGLDEAAKVQYVREEVEKFEPSFIDWSSFRREAAKDILSGLLSSQKPSSCTIESEVGLAIHYADELIKQLKEEKE